MKVKREKAFANGKVYLLETSDGYPIETTDTFLPFYTKDCTGRKQNSLTSTKLGSRKERWMVGVSTMSGCPVRCKFCATGKLKRWRNLSAEEIVEQVIFILERNKDIINQPKEFKINYTRMGEPFLNIDNVKEAIQTIDKCLKWKTHHYISTIGIKNSDFSWIRNNVTLQISLHSLFKERRNWLIPYNKKLSIEELGKIRTDSKLKTTVNLTLVDKKDFDINVLKENFNPSEFFVKLSPINENETSNKNNLGSGVVEGKNLI